MPISLEQPLFLLLIPLGIYIIWKFVDQKGGIGFSSVNLFSNIKTGISFLTLERILLSIFLLASGLILAKPIEIVKNRVPVYKNARDISIVLDLSGSMYQENGKKMDTAKSVIEKFVEARPQDRLALFTFEGRAYMDWPLSFDHEALISRLKEVHGGGGTVIGSGLIASLQNQKRFGEGSGAVILISDGISEVSDREKTLISNNLGKTKLYWILIGNEQQDLATEFSFYIESLGGMVFQGEAEDLSGIFAEISQLETTPVVFEERVSTTYRFGILPILAFFSLLGAGLLEMLREV